MSYFAIFPDYKTGREAFSILLKTANYIGVTLDQFPRRYTGIMTPNEPDTAAVKEYRDNLRKISGFDMNRTIGTFQGQEYEKLLNAIQRCEGWYPGNEELIEVKKIVRVRCVKRKPVEFLVQSFSGTQEWVRIDQAIRLAEEGSLHAVVVHTRHGVYLRSFPHRQKFAEMLVLS
jgi:hypothetical protein